MSKTTFQQTTITRILNAAPKLRYVAVYNANDEWLSACLRNYQGRSLVYVLTCIHDGQEHYLYAGQSTNQYGRLMEHFRKFACEYIYLLECDSPQLTKAEAAVIRALAPLYNRFHNPLWERSQKILGIDESPKDAKTVHRHLERKLSYEPVGLYGFSLPGAVFSALEQAAQALGLTCSELLQHILEKTYPEEIARQVREQDYPETNLISCEAYGRIHGRCHEQIKHLCQQGRISGAVRIARNWVMPKDAPFPEDLRRKMNK